jgi:hypothetical protein
MYLKLQDAFIAESWPGHKGEESLLKNWNEGGNFRKGTVAQYNHCALQARKYICLAPIFVQKIHLYVVDPLGAFTI